MIRTSFCTVLGVAAAVPGSAQGLSSVAVRATTIPVATNLLCGERWPAVFAPRPDGAGSIGYTDTKGNARVFAVDGKLRKSGAEIVVDAHRLVALHANADGSSVLLASTEEGPSELRPGWCRGDNTLWAIKVDGKGKTAWRTHLVGGKGYGPQQTWFFPNSAGVLGHNGAVYGGFYSIGKNFARGDGAPNSHEGDEFKAFDDEGKVREDLSRTWNVSHSADQRMVVDGADFLTLTMGDTYPFGVVFKPHPGGQRRVVWPDPEQIAALQRIYKKSSMPGELGGIARLGDGLAAIATTFVPDGIPKSVEDGRRFVLFLRFDREGGLVGKQYLLPEPGSRRLRTCIGRFGRHVLVGWGTPGSKDTTLAVLDEDGKPAFGPWRCKHPLGHRAGFVALPDGDLVWLHARNGSRKIELFRAVLPKALRDGRPK